MTDKFWPLGDQQRLIDVVAGDDPARRSDALIRLMRGQALSQPGFVYVGEPPISMDQFERLLVNPIPIERPTQPLSNRHDRRKAQALSKRK